LSSLIAKYDKLALGCGHKNFNDEGYLNLDVRKWSHIDVVCDAGEPLPFKDNTFKEVLAESVLEHINHNEEGVPTNFRMSKSINVLREWRRVLKPEGRLIIRVPNLEGVFKQYIAGNMSTVDMVGYVYGGGEYLENYHKAGFDTKIMSSCLRNAGFSKFKIVDPHRYDHKLEKEKSWEMGVVAWKT